mmetsp:Transcript_62410/g.123333  ORF Transcript_62410/g.123333 Transcript_62410/m.123333 type:complete len:258 (-) Transcript_62410:215-988(-)
MPTPPSSACCSKCRPIRARATARAVARSRPPCCTATSQARSHYSTGRRVTYRAARTRRAARTGIAAHTHIAAPQMARDSCMPPTVRCRASHRRSSSRRRWRTTTTTTTNNNNNNGWVSWEVAPQGLARFQTIVSSLLYSSVGRVAAEPEVVATATKVAVAMAAAKVAVAAVPAVVAAMLAAAVVAAVAVEAAVALAAVPTVAAVAGVTLAACLSAAFAGTCEGCAAVERSQHGSRWMPSTPRSHATGHVATTARCFT